MTLPPDENAAENAAEEAAEEGENAAERLFIDGRYEGSRGTVLGGYLAGLMVARRGGRGSVTLRSPLLVESDLTFVSGEPDRLLDPAGTVVAEAVSIESVDVVPPIVSLDEAAGAAAGYLGLRGHLFPRCFCCGPARAAGEGLRIFPGPLGGSAIVAARWTPGGGYAVGPEGTVSAEIVCAALDCPAIWALIAATDPSSDEKAVTGRLEIVIGAPVEAGQPYAVVGWPIGSDGRKRYAGSAIEAADGSVVAVARQTMIVTGNGVPLGTLHWVAAGPGARPQPGPGPGAASKVA